MSPAADLVVLVRGLAPSVEADDVVELVTWLCAARPDLAVRVVATEGGALAPEVAAVAELARLDATPEARAGRLAQRSHLAVPARAARSRGLRRLLGAVAAPVLVTGSAGRSLNWLDPAARPVVGRAVGTAREALDPADRAGLDDRVTAWADGPALLRQPGGAAERDDEPGVRARQREVLARDLGVAVEAPLVVVAGAEDEALPPDAVLGTAWQLVERTPGVQVLWATAPLAPPAAAQVDRHLADAGLAGAVHRIEPGTDWWRLLAAADAVVTGPRAGAGVSELAERIAPGRVVRPALEASAAETASAAAAVLPGGAAWTEPDDRWHAPVGGPRILELLGLAD